MLNFATVAPFTSGYDADLFIFFYNLAKQIQGSKDQFYNLDIKAQLC